MPEVNHQGCFNRSGAKTAEKNGRGEAITHHASLFVPSQTQSTRAANKTGPHTTPAPSSDSPPLRYAPGAPAVSGAGRPAKCASPVPASAKPDTSDKCEVLPASSADWGATSA